MATKDLKVGDKVTWSSTQGKIEGTVKKKLTAPMDIKTHHVAASPDNPQLLVQSSGTGQLAAHKPASLTPVKNASPAKADKAAKTSNAAKPAKTVKAAKPATSAKAAKTAKPKAAKTGAKK